MLPFRSALNLLFKPLQVGFFSGFVMPLYTTFQDVFPATKKVRARAQANFEYWLSREEAAGDKADG